MSNEVTRCKPLLGTYVEIRMYGANAGSSDNEQRLDAAFDAIALCGRLMSFHDARSELSLLNQCADARPVKVHPWTYEVISQAKALYHDSDGLFDAGVGAELVQWGLLPERDFAYPANNPAPSTLASVGLLADNTIRYTSPACLDLGGIAKGFAVDKAIEILRSEDIESVVVNAGGDLRVTGKLDEPVHIRHPRQPDQLVFIGMISNGAVATSSPYFSVQKRNNDKPEQVCALVDAKKRTSLTDQHSYTVIAPTCCIADALTKILASGAHPESDYFKKYQAQALII